MKNFWKMYSRNLGFWLVLYAFGITIALVIVSMKFHYYQCPKPTLPELRIEAQKQINTINNANDNHTIDSLFFELYGFKPNR